MENNLTQYITYNKEENEIELNLSRKELESIPKNLNNLTTYIEEQYGSYSPFKIIDLSYNKINTLSESDFKSLNYFDVIHLVGLKMKHIPSEIKFLENPMVLNFSWSDIIELPKELYKLTQLRSIKINWTSIKNFDTEIENLIDLVDVEVSETPFLETIYYIGENDGKPQNNHEEEVWKIKHILEKIGCQIEE